MILNTSSFDDDKLRADIAAGRAAPARPTTQSIIDQVVHRARAGAGLDFDVLEAIVGTNDLVEVNYLERGLMAARTVCRINVPAPVGNNSLWGTGFLIGPRLMLTNAHVIGTTDDALRSTIEFNYQLGGDGRLQRTISFRLAPQDGFVTSPKEALDYTIVAIEPASDDGKPVSDLGFMRLDPGLGKVDVGQYLTIIQHPDGGTKRVSLRENKLVKYGDAPGQQRDNFLWYSSDTAPGSSGAPVCTDAWQVVCVHHSGVPDHSVVDGVAQWVLTDGTTLPAEQAQLLPADKVKWLANEGVRVSRILADVQAQTGAKPALRSPLIGALVDDATGVVAFPGTIAGQSIIGPPIASVAPAIATPAPAPAPMVTAPEAAFKPSHNTRPASYFDGRAGYDPAFLGKAVPLPALGPDALRHGAQAKIAGTTDDVLRYLHFSIVFNADPARKIAFFTAVNIDGTSWTNLNRGDGDTWYYDPRLPEALQNGDELYGNEKVPGGNYFDRGHLVRRLDPVWGDLRTAAQANDDTFYWTNCSAQYKGFNEGKNLWAGLEDFILYNTDQENVRATVFSGPVLRDDDELHRGIMIPQLFWKVVIVADSAGTLSSSAYMVSQQDYALGIPFERLPVGPNSTKPGQNFQVPIAKIVADTGIQFDAVVTAADVYSGPANGTPIRSVADISHPRRR